MEISDQKRKQILRLITEGENLNLQRLGAFYRWVNDSYEALEFDPFQQQRFDEYCRSSCESHFIRVYIGLWILKLTLGTKRETHQSRREEPVSIQ
ncbi:MAG TPA: hypothetical protein VMC85_19430 [Desulfomonilaceae bacterium]|nr:hypothetical protein [Desulfomonilaceae bacterium]